MDSARQTLDSVVICICVWDVQMPEDIKWHFIGKLQSNKVYLTKRVYIVVF